MQSIIVNTKWDRQYCRFDSIEELVHHYIETGSGRNIKYALVDVVQCNIKYRDFLRENGYPALVERLRTEAPGLDDVENAFDWLDEWWEMVKDEGGLGDYDIQCYEVGDTVTLLGEQFNGLDSILSVVQISEGDKYLRPPYCNSKFTDKRKNRQSHLYAAELWEPYPKFDSYDDSDDRYYKCFFIRNRQLTDEFWNDYRSGTIYKPVRENWDVSQLPIVYHDGDDPVMYVLNPR